MESTTQTPTTLQVMAAPRPTAVTSGRIASVDLLRGLVMILMALDHVRDFFSNAFFNPLDLEQTTPALFLTRWITHLCAPAFVLLVGVGAFLYGSCGRTKAQVARFLLTRGLFLVALEFTIVHFGWFYNFDYHFLLAQVIWAIGWSMVALAGLIFLPTWALVTIGVVMITGHNLLDGLAADSAGALRWLWIVLHERGIIELAPDRQLFVLYPLVPWVGVMALGYALGPLFLRPPAGRRRWLIGLGSGLVLAFLALRLANGYGDPRPWSPQADTLLTVLSFINTEKYPPSLLFLLMTLGPALLLLAAFDRDEGVSVLARPLRVFGQVPLFYYVLHLLLIHASAVVFSYARHGEAAWLFGTDWLFRSGLPDAYGYELPVVYLVWLGVVVVLYPGCRWYAQFKQRQGWGWLSYL